MERLKTMERFVRLAVQHGFLVSALNTFSLSLLAHSAESHDRRPARRNSGITLIELLIASTLLMICSLGSIGLIVTCIGTNTRNRYDRTEAMLTQSLIEQI